MEWNFFDIGAKTLAHFYSKMIIDCFNSQNNQRLTSLYNKSLILYNIQERQFQV